MEYDWFKHWTNALRTKFLDCITKRTFYRGQKIITQGTNEQYLYVIQEGTANLIIDPKHTKEKFKQFECDEDPTRAKRYEEYECYKIPHK